MAEQCQSKTVPVLKKHETDLIINLFCSKICFLLRYVREYHRKIQDQKDTHDVIYKCCANGSYDLELVPKRTRKDKITGHDQGIIWSSGDHTICIYRLARYKDLDLLTHKCLDMFWSSDTIEDNQLSEFGEFWFKSLL